VKSKNNYIFAQLQKRMQALMQRVNKINTQLFDLEKEKSKEKDKEQAELARKQIDEIFDK
jgi:hypothetical protein